jgi:hypothetical protein
MDLRPHPEERVLARVSKVGRESMRCVHPSRRSLRKLLRMRTVSFTGLKAGELVRRGLSIYSQPPLEYWIIGWSLSSGGAPRRPGGG